MDNKRKSEERDTPGLKAKRLCEDSNSNDQLNNNEICTNSINYICKLDDVYNIGHFMINMRNMPEDKSKPSPKDVLIYLMKYLKIYFDNYCKNEPLKKPIRKLVTLMKDVVEALKTQNPDYNTVMRRIQPTYKVTIRAQDAQYVASVRVNKGIFQSSGQDEREVIDNVTVRAIIYSTLFNLEELKIYGMQFPCFRDVLKNDMQYDSIKYTDTQAMSQNIAHDMQMQNASHNFVKNTEIQSIDNGVPIADIISTLVFRKFESLSRDIKYSKYFLHNVLSGVVMVRNRNYENGIVVSLSTGNKCISGEYLTDSGTVIHDSHAEILARRGLVSFFYSEINSFLGKQENVNSIFEYSDNGKICVKHDVLFYLFINSAPCGDSRLFSASKKGQVDCGIDTHANRQNRGKLRLKVEVGNGTIPTNKYEITALNIDSIQKGIKYLTMCCSDKLLKRNVLGVQGSLLTHIIDPVYFEGIIIGEYFNISHSKRAFYSRIETYVGELQTPYRLNKPFIDGISKNNETSNTKSSYCINWIESEKSIEVINSKKGITLEDNPSRLCKYNLFKQFLRTLNVYKPAYLDIFRSYYNFKQDATVYQSVKTKLYEIFPRINLGHWVYKSKSFYNFCAKIEN